MCVCVLVAFSTWCARMRWVKRASIFFPWAGEGRGGQGNAAGPSPEAPRCTMAPCQHATSFLQERIMYADMRAHPLFQGRAWSDLCSGCGEECAVPDFD